jgi:formyl-CoA transferase
VPGFVPKLSRTLGGHRRNAPAIVQDTDDVLAGIDLNAMQVAEFKRRSVVAGGLK